MKNIALFAITACLGHSVTTANVAIGDFNQSDGVTLLPTGSLYQLGFLDSGNFTVFDSAFLTGPGTNEVPFRSLDVDVNFSGQLFLRIYDTPDDTGNFNTATNIAWTVASGPLGTPPDVQVFIGGQNEDTLQFLDAPAFQVAPEPTTFALAGLGGLALIARRKRA